MIQSNKTMMNISKKDREDLIRILQAGKEIPKKYRDTLLGEEDVQKEYELVYAGKAREEDIIVDTLAAPLQEVWGLPLCLDRK